MINSLMKFIGLVTIAGVLALGCDSPTDSDLEENPTLQIKDGKTSNLSHNCLTTEAGAGLTANYINEVPNNSFDVTCDVGIYFDEDTKVKGASLNGTVAGAKPVQYGIYIDGADVDISNSTVAVEDDYQHEFISVVYIDGSTGTLSKSDLSGAHRVGLQVRGEGTDVNARGNKIIGTGAKTSSWAENGVQVDQGAMITFTNNEVADHWWDGDSEWASTGVMLFESDNSSVTNNTFTDNEFSAYVIGNDNSFKSNSTSSDVVSESSFEFIPYGVLVLGSDNDITGNRLTATDGGAGIYIFPGSGSEDNKLTGNRISGFESPIYDGGDDTLEKGNPSVFN